MKDDHLCRAVHNVISLKRNCFRHAAAVCAKAVPAFMSGLSGMMLLSAQSQARRRSDTRPDSGVPQRSRGTL